jgi:release factor glutamine methyltransferase
MARTALAWGARRLRRAGIAEPRREARLLLQALAHVDPLLRPEAGIGREALAAYVAAVRRRAAREPFAYIVGRRFFRHLELAVDRRVLVPRPETEGVVERALVLLPQGGLAADLCTGSGAIALALAHERPDALVDAGDISAEALEVARDNVRRLGLEGRVRLWRGDLWEALPPSRRGAYDLCTCNPPYVAAEELPRLEPEVRDWEPRVALVAAEGWPALYGRLAAGAAAWLRPGGWLVAEVGLGQADTVAALFRGQGLTDVRVHPDLAGIPRVVEGRRPA